MTYRSGWELVFFQYLDAEPSVVSWRSETLKIPYAANRKTGRMRNYIPDVLVEHVGGKKTLVEIKPSKRVSRPVNVKKFTAARAWCAMNGVEFQVITEHELKELGLL